MGRRISRRKPSKGLVNIDEDKNRIRLRWTYQQKRYSLNLFLFTAANLLCAKKIALTIERDLLNDSFDPTLDRYKPAFQKKKVVAGEKLHERFEHWVRHYRNKDCETHIDYWAARNMLKRWGNVSTNAVVIKLGAEKINARTYNRRLTLLRKFYDWHVKHKLEGTNPFADVHPKKITKKVNPKRKPFSPEEIQRILSAIKHDTYCPKSSRFKHSHYYPFLFFIFKTGVRNAEAVGVRASAFDCENSMITIAEVLARTVNGANPGSRIRKETKNGKVRTLPFSQDLQAVILPLLKGKKSDDLVFTSVNGLAIDDRMFQRRVFKPVLKALGIAERHLYACRHTFGSRCIEAGLTPVMTAFLMGNNPETALRNYTHQMSLPDALPEL